MHVIKPSADSANGSLDELSCLAGFCDCHSSVPWRVHVHLQEEATKACSEPPQEDCPVFPASAGINLHPFSLINPVMQ